MNAIVVHGSPEEPLPSYRSKMKRFVTKHPTLGWGYDPFTNFADLLPSIQIAEGTDGVTTIVEIIAHGSPTYHQNIGKGTVQDFADHLRPSLPSPATTEVYLTGCNTGLSLANYCIAEELARALEEVTVFGAAGYVVKGAAASGDAQTRREADGNKAYSGSRDSSHPACWNSFHFPPSAPSGMRVARRSVVKPTPEIPADLLREPLMDALRAPRPVKLPALLIGPDFRGVVELSDGPFAYELLAWGAILRNGKTGEAYEFPQGPELIDRWLRLVL